MKKYLVIIESGLNNIGGCQLHIMRASKIIEAISFDKAAEIALSKNKHGIPFLPTFHYGHSPDYATVIDIKQLETQTI